MVERAMLCFWRLGYEGCSISALVSATGLKRQSLYNAFGSKEGLFERVLALYRQRVDESLVPLEADTADIEQISAYFRDFLAMQRKLGVGACFIVQTAYSPAMTSPAIREAVHASAQRVRNAFAQTLHLITKRDGRRNAVDCGAQAAKLYALLNGLSALASTGADRRLIALCIDDAMRQIQMDLDKPKDQRRSRR